jgi:hypothetical protein
MLTTGVVTRVMTGVTKEEAEETGLPISEALRQLMSHVSDTTAPGEQPVFLVWGPFCMTLLAQAVNKEGAAAVGALEAMADIPYVNMETWWSQAKPAKHPDIGVSPRKAGGLGKADVRAPGLKHSILAGLMADASHHACTCCSILAIDCKVSICSA